MPNKLTYFQESWHSDSRSESWVSRSKDKEMHDVSFAKRTLCYQIWEKEPYYLAMPPADHSIILKLETARQRETFSSQKALLIMK